MKRPESLARLVVLTAVFLTVGVPVFFWTRSPLVHARVAEQGGWKPAILKAEVGKPLHLRVTSDDVVHGFAIVEMDAPGVTIFPGKITDITLIFDKPGRYTFYCTRWCGLGHWRMEGVIEVTPAD